MPPPVLLAPARLARPPLAVSVWPSPACRFLSSCRRCCFTTRTTRMTRMTRSTRATLPAAPVWTARLFSAGPAVRSAEPPQPSPTPNPLHIEAAPLTDSQYHELADNYLDRMVSLLEDLQDAREDVDVEFAAGVLTLILTTDDGATRTYVVNKQPPNKQIWLSSPTSGPKRYDWVVTASHPDGGAWIYLKDGSSLNSLVREEIGIDLDADRL